MSKSTSTIIFLLSLAALASCEGYKTVHGVVKDRETHILLGQVLCKVVNEENGDESYASSAGKFRIHGPFGGCISDCPDVVIRFTKSGYQLLKIKNPVDTVFYLSARKN